MVMAGKGDGGKGTEPQGNGAAQGAQGKADDKPTLLELEVAGEKRVFRDVEELRGEFLKLHGEVTGLKSKVKDLPRLERLEELAKAAVLTGTADAERQLYAELGLSEREIGAIMAGRDDDEGEEDDATGPDEEDGGSDEDVGKGGHRGGRSGGRLDYDKVAEAVLRRLDGKVSLKSLDDESYNFLRQVAERVEAASLLVADTTFNKVKEAVAEDKIAGEYWKLLNEKQQKAALDYAVGKAGVSIKSGKRVTPEELSKVTHAMRSYLTDVYGSLDQVRRGAAIGIHGAMGVESEYTGFEDSPDEVLLEKQNEMNSMDIDGKKAGSLGERMRLAFELSKRRGEKL